MRRSTKRRVSLHTVLVLMFLCSGLAIGTSTASAVSTGATSDCWRDVLGDWFPDGRIDKIYPLPCYEQAVKHLPPDAKQYSGARDDIQRALQQALREKREPAHGHTTSSAPSSTTSSGGPTSTHPGAGGGAGGGGTDGGSSSTGGQSRGAFQSFIDKIGPANAESIPVPLLVLGGIAILLLLTAVASFVLRRLQARRLHPPEPDPEQL